MTDKVTFWTKDSPDRDEIMAGLNNELNMVVQKYITVLKVYEIYLVLVKMTDDIFRYWRKTLKEE